MKLPLVLGPIGMTKEKKKTDLLKSLKVTGLTLLHSNRPNWYTILAFLSAIGLNIPKFGVIALNIHLYISVEAESLLRYMDTLSGETTLPFSLLPPFSIWVYP